MKQIWQVGAVAVLAACSSPEDMRAGIGVEAAKAADAGQVSAYETRLEANSLRQIKIEQEGLSFTYAWPAKAAAIEELDALMEAKSNTALAEYEGYVAEAQADAKKYDYPFRPYQFGMGWEVSGETKGFLALAGAQSSYTGGAHGNSTYEALVWDKSAKTARAPVDLFSSPDALKQAVSEAYCTKLAAERAKRAGGQAVTGADIYEGCPSISELAVVLVSGEEPAFTRIDMVAAPYVAGSYAEGEYVIELPVTEAVREAVKPEYRDAFALPAD